LAKDKPPILGLIQRGGQVVLRMLANVQQATIKPVITAAAPGALVPHGRAGHPRPPASLGLRAQESVVQGSGGGAEALGDVGDRPPQLRMPIVPCKLNQDRRGHIPRQQHKVTNWPAYDASLRQRGSLTVWFTDEAIAAW